MPVFVANFFFYLLKTVLSICIHKLERAVTVRKWDFDLELKIVLEREMNCSIPESKVGQGLVT